MARSRIIAAAGAAWLLSAAAAAADTLLPPAAPGLVVTFRQVGGTSPGNEQRYRVTAIDGLRSTAEAERNAAPPLRFVLHSYRVWLSERVIQPQGTIFQDTPAALVDELAALEPGTIRIFPATLRYVPAPGVALQPNGQPNAPWTFSVQMTYEIERRERVQVPAGAFDTVVLKRTQEFLGPGGTAIRRETTRTWYAPALRWWVKIEARQELPDQPAITHEAIEITRP